MKKPTVKSVTTAFEIYRGIVKEYITSIRYPKRRALLSVVAADAQGKLNGMTIVELITVVRLTEKTDEKVYITVGDKEITLWAEKFPPKVPFVLL